MKKYIEADLLKQKVESIWYGEKTCDEFYNAGYDDALSDVLDIMDNMPASDVQEVKHGRWAKTSEHIIFANGETKEWVLFYCSECDAPNVAPTDYCPHCGARMDGK